MDEVITLLAPRPAQVFYRLLIAPGSILLFYIIITVGPVATREHFTISGAQGSNIAAFSAVHTVQYSTYSTSSPRLLAAMCCFQEQFQHLVTLIVLLNGLFAKSLL